MARAEADSAGQHYQRLSAMDAMFVEIEDANLPMHIGSVALFEVGPLLREGGGLDFERILAAAAAQLHRTPRLRQKLATIPLTEHPIWIDDPNFDLHYHVRHAALPHPGDVRQLKRLAGRILSQLIAMPHGTALRIFGPLLQGVEGRCDSNAAPRSNIRKIWRHHLQRLQQSDQRLSITVGSRAEGISAVAGVAEQAAAP